MDINKKSVGIANTNSNLNYYEEYYGSGSNNVGLGNIWYDSHLIPSQPPATDTPVVRLMTNVDLVRVSATSNAFKLRDNLNDLKYAIFGSGCVNTVNVYTNTTEIMTNPYTNETGTDREIPPPTTIDYFPIITTDNGILGPSNSIYIDHASGLIYFNKVDPNNIPKSITFHKYVGRLGITQDIAVNWTNPIINYKTTIINTVISEPGAVLYYYYIRTNDNLHYKAGEIYINYNQTTAVLSDRIIEHSGTASGVDINNISFEAEVVLSSSGVIKLMLHCINLSGIYYLNITETETPITTLFDKASSYLRVSNLGDAAFTHNKILQLDTSVVGVVIYYTIIDQLTTVPVNPGRLNQQAGKLNYTWSVDNAGVKEVSGEPPVLNFPLIGENYIIEFSTEIDANNKFILYADINGTDKKYTIELNYITYNMSRVINNIPSGTQIIDSLDRAVTNYKIYKYCLRDNALPRPNVTCGEIAVICDSTGVRAVNYRYTKSAGRGPANDLLLIPDENTVTSQIDFDAIDFDNLVNVRLISSTTTDLYLFEKTTPLSNTLVFPSSNPSNVNPIILPSTEVSIPINNVTYPYTHTLLTLSPSENAHVFIVTATNDIGCKTTKEIAIYYTPNNPPATATPAGTGYFVSNVRTLLDDVGDCTKISIGARWDGVNPVIYADITSQIWTFATCYINITANYTNLTEIAAGVIEIPLDTLLLSSNGASYYYFIKTTDNLNMRMGDIFLSFNNSTNTTDASVVLDSRAFINPVYITTNPAGTIGNTFDIAFGTSIDAGTNSLILQGNNAKSVGCQIYLFKHTPISNIDSYIGGTNSIIKQSKTFTLNPSSTVLIDEFTETDKIKILNPTSVNPNKVDELMVSKVLHYNLNNTNTSPGQFARVGELFIQWQGSSLSVNDRFSYDTGRSPPDASIGNVSLVTVKTVTYVNNTYVYRIYAINTGTDTYNLRINPTIILSNLISVNSNVNVNINGNSPTLTTNASRSKYLIKYYTKNVTSTIVADYIIYDGTVGNNKRKMGSIKVMWDSINAASTIVNTISYNEVADPTGLAALDGIVGAEIVDDPTDNNVQKKLVALYLDAPTNSNYYFKMRDFTF